MRCADGTLYTGWTFDLARRVRAHQQGRAARYTRSRRPVALVYHERLSSRRAAMRRESAIKRMSRARKLALLRKGKETGANQILEGNILVDLRLTARICKRL